MSAAQVSSYMASAASALLAQDYDEALRYALAAQALLAGMPSANERDGNRMEWDYRGIDAFVINVRKQQTAARASSLGIQQTQVVYARPDSTGDYT